MRHKRFLFDTQGVASAELVLVLPFVLALLFTTFELGHFFWTQHKLTEAVRDGARYASRFRITDMCNGATAALSTANRDLIIRKTRTGQLASSTAVPKVPGWTDAQVTVTVSCQQFVNTGIYRDLGGAGPLVTVAATNVTYPSLLNRLGLISTTVQLNARSNGAVIGI